MDREPFNARQVADWTEGQVVGDENVEITGLAPIDAAGPGDLTFALDARRAGQIPACGASVAIVPADTPACEAKTLILVADPAAAVAGLLEHLGEPVDLPPAGVHPTAVVHESARLGVDVAIGPHVSIGADTVIGDRTVVCAGVRINADVQIGEDGLLGENVVVKPASRIGDRVRIGPNTVIGWDGFGYFTHDGVHHRIPHVGGVSIGDDVDLGACVCVDRAKFGLTTVEDSVKVDNLVQIAHNVQVGQGSLLVGQCGLAGSARLGRYVVIGGSAGVRDNVTLGDGAKLAAYSALAGNAEAGETYAGTPALPARETRRVVMAWKRLPDLLKRVKELEARLAELESSEDH